MKGLSKQLNENFSMNVSRQTISFAVPNTDLFTFKLYKCDESRYRKITIIIPGLINILSTFWGAYTQRGLYSGGLYSEGILCQCRSMKTLKFIVIYRYHRQKRCFFRPKSFWTSGLPEGVLSNRPCPLVRGPLVHGPLVRP